MRERCDDIAEQVALGEPVGDLEHVAGCERCQRTVAIARDLAGLHHAADPGLGFSARVTVGAQRRLVVRRRRRVAGGLAAMVAAGLVGVVAMIHATASDDDVAVVATTGDDTPTRVAPDHKADHPTPPTAPATATSPTPGLEPDASDDPDDAELAGARDHDVAALVQVADTDRARGQTADWDRIAAPLAPYNTLLEGDKP